MDKASVYGWRCFGLDGYDLIAPVMSRYRSDGGGSDASQPLGGVTARGLWSSR